MIANEVKPALAFISLMLLMLIPSLMAQLKAMPEAQEASDAFESALIYRPLPKLPS